MLFCESIKQDFMLKKHLIFFSFLFTLFIVSCAKRGSIEGGPKDTIAPVLKMSFPLNFSTNFKSKTIQLTFDEYVKLKNIEKQLVISPPLKRMPEFNPSSASKIITIKIKDTLQENTTYSFDFGKSIEDNNEGNPIKQFKYVFSTGTYIDSLKLKGIIKDAYDKTVAPMVSILLYEVDSTYNDSVIYKENPRYITRTLDSATTFEFENLKSGKYQLIAIKDENNNNKFDPKKEKIGFSNEYITLPNDTVFELKLFPEKSPFIAYKPSQASGNRSTIGYQGDPKGIKIVLKNQNEIIPTIITKVQDKDSVQFWHKPQKADSLSIAISHDKYQSDFIFKIKNQKNDSLSFNPKTRGILHFREQFTVKSSTPLTKFDASKMTLLNKDSITVPFKTEYDEWNQDFIINFQKEPNEKYRITLLPGALTDFMEHVNDTLSYPFDTKSTADYGNLNLTLENIKHFPIIVELTNKKGDIMATAYSENSSKIDFKLVEPNLFNVRIIYDVNKNGIWDSGNFLTKEQAEEVLYFPKTIDVRANWDVEQTISLKP